MLTEAKRPYATTSVDNDATHALTSSGRYRSRRPTAAQEDLEVEEPVQASGRTMPSPRHPTRASRITDQKSPAVDQGSGDGDRVRPLHEVAAWRLAAALGKPFEDMVLPTVLREVNGSWGSNLHADRVRR